MSRFATRMPGARIVGGGLIALGSLVMSAILAPAAEAANAEVYETVAARAESIVTVSFVLRIKIEGGGDREIESEADCLMVGADGLVLCSNTELGGYVSMLGRMIGGGRLTASGSAAEIKVSYDDDTEGTPARLLTRDTERDLAWLRLEPDAGEALSAGPYLDLAADAAELVPGETFYAIRRMHRFFDRVPVVVEGAIGAVTTQPRHLMVPALPLEIGFGLPVFDHRGVFAGITVMQTPTAEEAQSLMANPMSFLGSAAKAGDMVGGLILPASEIAKATALAREIIAADDAESAD